MPPSGRTTEQLLKEAQAADELAGIVSYGHDKRALRERAEQLREQARALDVTNSRAAHFRSEEPVRIARRS